MYNWVCSYVPEGVVTDVVWLLATITDNIFIAKNKWFFYRQCYLA